MHYESLDEKTEWEKTGDLVGGGGRALVRGRAIGGRHEVKGGFYPKVVGTTTFNMRTFFVSAVSKGMLYAFVQCLSFCKLRCCWRKPTSGNQNYFGDCSVVEVIWFPDLGLAGLVGAAVLGKSFVTPQCDFWGVSPATCQRLYE